MCDVARALNCSSLQLIMASEEENLGSGSVPCKPQVVGADSQSFDQNRPPTAVTDVDAAKSPVPAADGSQLVGAKVAAVDSGGAKKKRGRPPRALPKPPPAKKNREDEEEDVCFICFDGGSLVLCDRRGCPKAYHPACIKRDEAFFRSKAKWNCGWHICSICQKAAHHMCYTCTYSLCKGCIRKSDYVSVRGDRGFCTICMRTIMLIENSAQGKEAQVDFDDKTSWEYLFKVYWVYLKGKLSLTLDELTQARNPWKEAGIVAGEDPLPRVHNVSSDIKSISNLKSITAGNVAYQGQLPGVDDAVVDLKSTSNHKSITSVVSVGNLEESESKRRKTDELLKVVHEEADRLEKSVSEGASLLRGCKEWATKELLEFVAHMKNGDTSALSQFDVQALMLEYIKRNNLRDPRRKSQIICDSRLKNLFGKQRVGHFEMLKLLEFHFLIKDDSQKNIVNTVTIQGEADWNSDSIHMMGKDRKRKTRRKVEEQFPPNNLDEFAAIDVHNMNLIYLRRNLMETLTDDKEKFHAKVVGSIVRIRISGNDQKQETHRLTQVVGTSKVEEPYKIGNRSIDFKLEVLNLDKKETVPIDAISNQELSEDECRRLRQSIRCGLAKRFTVGEIQEKAMALQSVKLNDWMETEIMRLNHLRDRANEKGHKKELRECVEKLQLLKTPEERQRRLSEIPLVHSDPKMNPEYVSEEDASEHNNKKHGQYMKQNYSAISSKGRKSNSSPKKAEILEDAGSRHFSSSEQTRIVSVTSSIGIGKDTLRPNSVGRQQSENGSVLTDRNHQAAVSSSFSTIAPEAAAASLCARSTPSADSEEDKLWHYRDPNGKVQGPFSMVQLQKWNMTGYFPLDMRIWMSREEDSLLLTDALRGEFHNHDVRSSGNMIATERVGNPSVGPLLSSTLSGTSHASSLQHQRGNEAERVNLGSNCGNIEDNSNSHVFSGQSSGQNWGALPEDPYAHNNLNSNLSVGSLTKPTDLTKHSGRTVDVPNLDSPTPNGGKLESEDQDTGKKQPASSMIILQDLGLLDLPSPTPNTRSEEEKVPDTGNKESVPSKLLVQDTGPSWSSASTLGGGGVQLPEAANGWPRYSSTQVKTSVEEWDSGLVSASLKPLEATGDHRVVTSTSHIGPIIHALPSQPTINMSWPAGMHEPIEFSTLAEESVSDLLAEVDAMESQNGLPSPTSKRINISEDLFHGSIEEFSPTPDQGTRSDGFSSTDVQLPCQSATPDELVGASHANVFDFLSRSSGLQSTISTDIDGVEAKSIEAVKHMGTVEISIIAQKTSSEMVRNWAEMNREEIKKTNEIQPPALLTRKQDMIDMNNARRASDGALLQPSAGADTDRETKANEILLKQDESINTHAPPATHTDVVDLNIAGVAGPEGMDYIWENGKEERAAHQAETGTATKSSAQPVAEKEDGEFQPSASLTMSLGLFEPKTGQKAVGMEVINPVWNSSNSTTTLDQNNAGEGMTHQSSATAGVGTEDDIRPLTLSLDLGDPHIGRKSASSSDLAQGNTNPGRSSGQGIIPNPGRGNNANVNANRSSGFGWDTQRRYGGERFNSPRDGGERFNSPRERERAYQGEELGFSRGRTSWSRQSSFGGGGGGSGSGSGGGHSRPSPKGQRICKFYESGRCKKGASCNYLHP